MKSFTLRNRTIHNGPISILSIFLLCFFLCACQTGNNEKDGEDEKPVLPDVKEETVEDVVLGDERFDAYLPLLEGKRVALYTNQSGIVGDKIVSDNGLKELEIDERSSIPFGKDEKGNDVVYGKHILDLLIEKGVDVTAVFVPEHGFRGNEDAGASIDDSFDPKTGVPLLSLYGYATGYPSKEDMDRFDILVVDMQDVGLRYYTYYIGMYHLMESCAEYDKKMIILDRPDPNGFYVDGPVLKEGFQSDVGALPLPVVYGMTWGELGRMINGEGWLKTGKDSLDLTVIACENYRREDSYSLIVRPSPNLKDMRAVYLYASTCFFENTPVSVGRGTWHPFEVYGSPYLESVSGYEYTFVPQSMDGANTPLYEDEICYGRDLSEMKISEIRKKGIDLSYLIDAFHVFEEMYPDVSFWGNADENGRYWIDLLSGSDELRLQIEAGKTAEEIKASWKEDIASFMEMRKPYLIYE